MDQESSEGACLSILAPLHGLEGDFVPSQSLCHHQQLSRKEGAHVARCSSKNLKTRILANAQVGLNVNRRLLGRMVASGLRPWYSQRKFRSIHTMKLVSTSSLSTRSLQIELPNSTCSCRRSIARIIKPNVYYSRFTSKPEWAKTKLEGNNEISSSRCRSEGPSRSWVTLGASSHLLTVLTTPMQFIELGERSPLICSDACSEPSNDKTARELNFEAAVRGSAEDTTSRIQLMKRKLRLVGECIVSGMYDHV
ncbi:hypothetical protein PM082_021702 [Marasmius tenuissimus]|nr:hypothetical protein PM082_021702 [Marasmius tenuissimus]